MHETRNTPENVVKNVTHHYVRIRVHIERQCTHRHSLATGLFTPLPNAHTNRIGSISDEGCRGKQICSLSYVYWTVHHCDN